MLGTMSGSQDSTLLLRHHEFLGGLGSDFESRPPDAMRQYAAEPPSLQQNGADASTDSLTLGIPVVRRGLQLESNDAEGVVLDASPVTCDEAHHTLDLLSSAAEGQRQQHPHLPVLVPRSAGSRRMQRPCGLTSLARDHFQAAHTREHRCNSLPSKALEVAGCSSLENIALAISHGVPPVSQGVAGTHAGRETSHRQEHSAVPWDNGAEALGLFLDSQQPCLNSIRCPSGVLQAGEGTADSGYSICIPELYPPACDVPVVLPQPPLSWKSLGRVRQQPRPTSGLPIPRSISEDKSKCSQPRFNAGTPHPSGAHRPKAAERTTSGPPSLILPSGSGPHQPFRPKFRPPPLEIPGQNQLPQTHEVFVLPGTSSIREHHGAAGHAQYKSLPSGLTAGTTATRLCRAKSGPMEAPAMKLLLRQDPADSGDGAGRVGWSSVQSSSICATHRAPLSDLYPLTAASLQLPRVYNARSLSPADFKRVLFAGLPELEIPYKATDSPRSPLQPIAVAAESISYSRVDV